jgi:mannose-6-phosphate isomerase-like protein (cupin superfamily)
MRKPFRKNIQTVAIEEAHGGSGSRRLLLSKDDAVSQHFQAMTKGYLEPKGVFDWHKHDGIDEYFIVLRGNGTIEFRDEPMMNFGADDLIYVPAGTEHRIENTGKETVEFFFVRLDS